MMSTLREHITYLRYLCWIRKDRELLQFMDNINIMDSKATVEKIITEKLSVSRYGDGEFAVMAGGSNGFQKVDDKLALRLREILANPVNGHLTCIPYVLKNWSHCRFESKLFSAGFNCTHLLEWVKPYVKTNYEYGNSLFTRFYMMRKDKSRCSEYVQQLKKIWDQKDLLIVEGENSRLGVGNDLFANANSIERILCPNKDAYDRYNEILAAAEKYGRNKLILIALGMTATVLAYDLAKLGYRAIDVGHVDIEYMWMLMGAKEKCSVPGKNVNEVGQNLCEGELADEGYQDSILTTIE